MNVVDAVLGQIGMPNGMMVRGCSEHGKYLVPRGSKFTCPGCSNLHSIPDGTGGNGDTAAVAQAKSAVISHMNHYISLGQ